MITYMSGSIKARPLLNMYASSANHTSMQPGSHLCSPASNLLNSSRKVVWLHRIAFSTIQVTQAKASIIIATKLCACDSISI